MTQHRFSPHTGARPKKGGERRYTKRFGARLDDTFQTRFMRTALETLIPKP